MSLSKSTPGDDFVREYNIRAKKPKSGYTAAVGDLVVLDFSVADGVDRGAADENAYGMVLSINSSNGTLSVAEFTGGVTVVLEWVTTQPGLSDKVECVGSRGTIYPSRDRVRVDNSNGTGAVIAFDATSPAGTGTVVVRYP